ncbi:MULTISPECIES: FCD domain-containing protein [unclassified Roseitalea]|uniref:FCD domain-containing protein n=1 Tax=unclassified Roseitalea TaxID=2639107 RepID=UPI00273F0302|nr:MULTISPECIES: FCD domain-containing protein [unclassified Roseitalea]
MGQRGEGEPLRHAAAEGLERIDAARNQFLDKFYRLARDFRRRLHLLHYYPLFDEAQAALTVGQHKAIAKAVRAGDCDRADRPVGVHLMAEPAVIQRSLAPRFGNSFTVSDQFGGQA